MTRYTCIIRKVVLTLITLMTLGVGEMWGQTIVPQDGEVVTFHNKEGVSMAYEKSTTGLSKEWHCHKKTINDADSRQQWIIEDASDGNFYIKNKYLSDQGLESYLYQAFIENQNTDNWSLGYTDAPEGQGNKAKYKITESEDYYQIRVLSNSSAYVGLNDKDPWIVIFADKKKYVYWQIGLPAPVITIDGTNCSISCPNTTATIYYTTDGSDPTSESTTFSGSFTIPDDCKVIKAIAVKTGYVNSTVAEKYSTKFSWFFQNISDNGAFYMVPGDEDASGNTTVTTTSLGRASMQWNFVDAGSNDGIQYYYINNNSTKDYLFCNSSGNVYMKSSTDFGDGSSDDYKFSIVSDASDGIRIASKSRPGYWIFKGESNNKIAVVATENSTSDTKGRWNILTERVVEEVPFTVSTDENKTFYRIQNANATDYYIVPNSTNTQYATTSTISTSDMLWYFKEAATDDWNTYYYIINAQTGEYLYANGEITNSQINDAFITKDHPEIPDETEDRFQFAVPRTTQSSDGYYYIVPKPYKDFSSTYYYLVWKDSNNALKIQANRDNNNLKWLFKESLLAPVINYSDNQFTITYPGNNDDVTIYYTTDGTDPTKSSHVYQNTPIDATEITIIKAYAVKTDLLYSPVSLAIKTGISILLQNADNANFYMTSLGASVDTDENYVTTTNIPGNDMSWRLIDAGIENNIQYYYFVNDKDTKYLCYNSGVRVKPSSTFTEAVDKSIYKFRIVSNSDGSLLIFPYGQSCPLRKNGNNSHGGLDVVNTQINNFVLWNVINVPATPKDLFDDATFVSPADCKQYYKIKNARTGDAYYLTPTATVSASTAGDHLEWYFESADDEDTWASYYYIRNAYSGEYLYYDGKSGEWDKFFMGSSPNEKYKFIIVPTANKDALNSYIVVPKAFKENLNQENNSMHKGEGTTNGIRLLTYRSRADIGSDWYLTSTDFNCEAPVISYNIINGTISMTCSNAGAKIYYKGYADEEAYKADAPSLSSGVEGFTLYYGEFTPTQPYYKAIATRCITTGNDQSAVKGIGPLDLSFKCVTPVISYNSSTATVTISTLTEGATIYYSLDAEIDAQNPTTGTTLYSTPFVLDGTHVVRAIAVKGDASTASNVAVWDKAPRYVSYASEINSQGMNLNYVLNENFSADATIGTELNPFTGTIDGRFHALSLDHPLVNCTNGATIKNVVLDNVQLNSPLTINSTTCLGAIVAYAAGSTKIYNCGILSKAGTSSISGGDNTGSIAGYITGDTRVINNYSYANVSGSEYVGGIVGHVAGTALTKDNYSDNAHCAVMNNIFYGNLSGSSNVSPVYAGNHTSNVQNVNEYNFWRSKATVSYNDYHDQLAIDKDVFLNRFPFYRHILNTHRELAAIYLYGTVDKKDEIAHWYEVKNDAAIPYPILETWQTNTKRTTVDIKNNLPNTTEQFAGKLLNNIGSDGYYTGSGELVENMGKAGYLKVNYTIGGTTGSVDLPITDIDSLNYDFTWGKVILPFANELWTQTDYSKVVTGWKITSVKGGTTGELTNYNFADRDCTAKDIYNETTNPYIFAQGDNYIVPYGVTDINIEANFATAYYLSDAYYDFGYKDDYSGTTNLTTTVPTTYHEQMVYTNLSTLLDAMSANVTTPHQQAIVLVGNFHYNQKVLGTLFGNKTKGLTIMSVDEDCNQEPDYGWYSYHTEPRTEIPPMRFDFVPNIGIGMAARVTASTPNPSIGIWHGHGWFELTKTALSYMTEFEINSDKDNADDDGYGNNRWIANSGYFAQIIRAFTGDCSKLSYVQIGGNAYVEQYYPTDHIVQSRFTYLRPTVVTGGEIVDCFMTGNHSDIKGDDIYFWCAGGKIHKYLSAYTSKLKNENVDVTAKIDHARIYKFFGGGTSAAAPVTGNINVTINNSLVDFYCGGPEFGDMKSGKTVTTNAIGSTFGEYYGAGFGGTSLSLVYITEQQNFSFNNATNTFPLAFSNYKYLQTNGDYGLGAGYAFDFFLYAGGVGTGVARIYTKYARFSLATTGNVTNTLSHCKLLHDYYGAGCQGKVNGTVTSTLTDCTVTGSAFGGGYQASANTVMVYPNTQPTYSTYTKETGTFSDFGTVTPEEWHWEEGTVDTYSNTQEKPKTLYTNVDMDELGNVSGAISITVNGGTVGKDVFGGGNESKSLDNTSVTIENGADISGDVYGAGKGDEDDVNVAYVTGNATVSMSGGTVKKSVYGGGQQAQVGGNTEITVSGGTIGTSGQGGATYGNVYGGGMGNTTSVAAGLIKGNTNITIQNSPTILHSVYGGGAYGSVGQFTYDATTGMPTSLTSGGVATINIKGGIIGSDGKENGMVYGSSRGDVGAPGEVHDKLAWVYEAHVNIGTDGSSDLTTPFIKGSVYGSGENGHTFINTYINVYSGKIGIDDANDADGGFRYAYRGNVYGGGCGTDTYISDDKTYYNPLSGIVLGNTTVNMTGGHVVRNVYGGGAMGSVGTFTYADEAYHTDHTDVPVGKPYAVAANTGKCTVNISGGEVGPDGMQMTYANGPDDAGHVFGASRGEMHDPTAYPNLEQVVYVDTTEVTISGTAFIKGSVYGGSESGHMLHGTWVKIQGGQIGEGEGQTAPYSDWTATSLAECAHWDYEVSTDIHYVYDKYANESGNYSSAEYGDNGSANGGRKTANNGQTYYGNVFAGGRGLVPYAPGKWLDSAGRVEGSTKLEMTDGHVLTSVYGGNEMTDVLGCAEVKITGGTVGVPRTLAEMKAHPVTCYVFGAGKGDQRTWFNTKTNVHKTVTVEVSGSARIFGSVFGGGEDGHIFGDANTKIGKEGQTSTVIIGTTGTSSVDGNIFGGGRGFSASAYTAGSIGGNVNLDVYDGTIMGTIYGGGRLASVGSYFVNPKLDNGDPNPKYGTLQPDTTDTTPQKLHGHVNIHIYGGTIGATDNGVLRSSDYSIGDIFGGCKGTLYNDDNVDPEKFGVSKCSDIIIDNGIINGNVYGGGEMGGINKGTHVTVNNGTIGGSVYGGGKGSVESDVVGFVHHNVQVDIVGGTIGKNVYGGGAIANTNTHDKDNTSEADKCTLTTKEDCTTIVNLTGGLIKGDAYGGGEGVSYTPTNKWDDNDKTALERHSAFVWGDVTLTLNGTAFQRDSIQDNNSNYVQKSARIFGGNNLNGTPKGTVLVNVKQTKALDSNGTAKAKAFGTYELAAVYGGGNLAAYDPHSATATGQYSEGHDATGKPVQVVIEGCSLTSIENVYGGGNAADVPVTDVLILGSYELGSVFGGGNGKDKYTLDGTNWLVNPGADVGQRKVYGVATPYGSGNANTDLIAGYIHEAYGGSNEKGNIKGSINITSNPKESGDAGYCCDLDVKKVVGAGKNANVDGDIILVMGCMPEAKTDLLFAGADNANVNGNVELTITSGNFGQVFGGNNLGGAIKGHIKLNIEETGCRAINIDSLYLGGNQAAYSIYGYKQDGDKLVARSSATDGDAVANPTDDATHSFPYAQPVLNIISATHIGKVFGGGLGTGAAMYASPTVNINMIPGAYAAAINRNPEDSSEKKAHYLGNIGDVYGGGNEAAVYGSTTINIGTAETVTMTSVTDDSNTTDVDESNPKVEGARITGNVYGGGNLADVTGDTQINIGTKAYTTENFEGILVQGNVFGAGKGDENDATKALVGGNTTVLISGGQIDQNVYGGGQMSSVGDADEVKGTVTDDYPFGYRTGTAKVTINGTASLGTAENCMGEHGKGYVYGSGLGEAGKPGFAFVKNTIVTIGGTAEGDNPTVRGSVFGSGEDGHVRHDTQVNVKSGTIGTALTGEEHTENNGEGAVIYRGNVYGGGRGVDLYEHEEKQLLSTTAGIVYGNATVNITGGLIYHDVYGAGSLASVGTITDTNEDSKTDFLTDNFTEGTGVTTVNISGGQIGDTGFNDGRVYGAGRGASGQRDSQVAHMEFVNKTFVNISGSADIRGCVFGGGENGHVKSDTKVTISGGVIGTELTADEAKFNTDGTGTILYRGNVYGGGRGVDHIADLGETLSYTAGRVYGNTEVIVTSGTIRNSVYGGGSLASVGKYTVDANENITALVSGGIAKVTISGGLIGNTVNPGKNNGNVFGSCRGMVADNEDAQYSKMAFVDSTCVTINEGADIRGCVFGGGENGHVFDDTGVYINGGIIGEPFTTEGENAETAINETTGANASGHHLYRGNVYGGGRGVDKVGEGNNEHLSATAGRVYGNTYVEVSGGTIRHNVFGGGSLASVGTFTTDKNAEYSHTTSVWSKGGDTHVTISGGTIGQSGTNNGFVFGSGRGMAATSADAHKYAQMAFVNNTYVTIGGGTVKGSVFGSGENGHVHNNTLVTVNGGTIGSAGCTKFAGNIYGGGRGVDGNADSQMSSTAGWVGGTTSVNITGGQIYHDVYGGGSMGSVGVSTEDNTGEVTVLVNGGTVGVAGETGYGNVYGGGRGMAGDAYANLAFVKRTFVTIKNDSTSGVRQAHVFGNVYGGGNAGHVRRGTTVTLASGNVDGNMYGGGRGSAESETAGLVHHNVRVYMNGGTVGKNVYGGGAIANTNIHDKDNTEEAENCPSDPKEECYTKVELNGGLIKGDAYGGGEGEFWEPTEDNKETYMTDTTQPLYNQQYWNATAKAEYAKHAAIVYGDVTVTLDGTAFATTTEKDSKNNDVPNSGRIFGCNNINGTPKGSVKVHVKRTIPVNDDGNTRTRAKGNYEVEAVYGGGNLAGYQPYTALLEKNAKPDTVLIEGCDNTSIKYVYGGGSAADVPATNVVITGAYEVYQAFGGGNGMDRIKPDGTTWRDNYGADVGAYWYDKTNMGTGNTSITVEGGTIHQVFGGSNTLGTIYGQTALNVGQTGDCELCVDDIFNGGNKADTNGGTVVLGCTDYMKRLYAGANAANVNGNVELTITSGHFDQVFAGNNASGVIRGSIKINIEETGCNPIIIGELYGGGNNAAYSIYGYKEVDGKLVPRSSMTDGTAVMNTGATAPTSPYDSPELNIKSFTSIGKVFGGGRGVDAVVYGNPTVNINEVVGAHASATNFRDGFRNGETIASYLGDGKTISVLNRDAEGNITEASETLDMPTHASGAIGGIGYVYGGGNAANVIGNTAVNICTVKSVTYKSGDKASHNVVGADIRHDVYGGGKGSADTYKCEKAMVGKDGDGVDNPVGGTSVTIGNGTVGGNVYGGGEVGRVEKNTVVTIGLENDNTSAPVISGSVFGAGKGVKTHGYAALVRGNPTVFIQGNAKIGQSVYGGGEIASVARYKVAETEEEAAAHGVAKDMPYALANETSGNCIVYVRDNAEIGPDGMKMYHEDKAASEDAPDDMGHVFGAGKGILPQVYDYTADNDDNKPKRMIDDNGTSKWEWFANEEKYIQFIQTLALASKTHVYIQENALVKGSVYGGSENGLVQYDTDVNIEGGQIGVGKNTTVRYTDDVWADNYVLPANTDLECASWEYGRDENNDNVKEYAPYDPYANATGELGQYANGKSTEGGRRIASDGHTFYGNVFGGGSGSIPYFDTEEGISKYLNTAGCVRGNTNVTISGGHILTNVYGGCEATNVLGDAKIVMTGGTLGVPRTLQQIVNHPVTCYLFGAGKGDQRIFFNKDTNVQSVDIDINGGRIYGSVFGGGEDGHVMRNVDLTIEEKNGQTIKIGTTGTSYVDGNVFGGGRGFGGDALTAGNVAGTVNLTIKSGTMLGSIYGGGRLASVGYGLYLVSETGYGVMKPDNQDDAGNAVANFKRGYININISGGTIGNDAEYIYNPTDVQKATIPYTTFFTYGDHQHLGHTKGGNVFAGCMGRMKKLDGTINDLWWRLARAKKTKVTISGDARIKSNVYGGAEFGAINEDAEVIIKGGIIGTEIKDANNVTRYTYGSVYGSGYGSDSNVSTNVTENNVEVTKKAIALAGVVYGNTSVTVEDTPAEGDNAAVSPLIYHNVYGGGELASVGTLTYTDNVVTNCAENTGSATVTITGGTVGLSGHEDGLVFGSGRGDIHEPGFYDQEAWVDNTTVTIGTANSETGPVIKGSVYGSGENGHTLKDTHVTVHSGTIGIDDQNDVDGGARYLYRGNVYGGGCGTDTYTSDDKTYYNRLSGVVRGNTNVTIDGGKVVRCVYGGGAMGSVGTFTYDDNGKPATCTEGTGLCTVSITGGEIGPNGMKMLYDEDANGNRPAPYDAGHVFGAGRGEVHDPSLYPNLEKVVYVNATDLTIGSDDENVTTTPFIKGSVYGGAESGHVLGDTYVKIKSGQIGQGEGNTIMYTDTQWENANASDFTECAHWPYTAGVHTVYDPFVTSVTTDANGYQTAGKYADNSDANGGVLVPQNGQTFYGCVFAGGCGYYPYAAGKWLDSAGLVEGNARLEMTGGHVLTNVYGGNEMTDVLGNSTVTITGGTIGVPRTLTDMQNHPVTCYVFGGGRGDQRTWFNTKTNIHGNATLTVSGTARVFGSVYGGGEDGHVFGNTETTLGNTATISDANVTIGTLGTSGVDGNVFGSGRGFTVTAYTAGSIGGNATLNINSGANILGSVYGGGRMASVGSYFVAPSESTYGTLKPDLPSEETADDQKTEKHGHTTINISGGTIGATDSNGNLVNSEFSIGDVFGGCKGSKNAGEHSNKFGIAKYTNIIMTNGTVNGSIYGGGEAGNVQQDTNISITQPEGNTTIVKGNVYGGGSEAKVGGNTNVVVGQ